MKDDIIYTDPVDAEQLVCVTNVIIGKARV